MHLKLLIVSFVFVCCYGQQRNVLPIFSKRYGDYGSGVAQVIPSGAARQFVSYPNVRRGTYADLNIDAPYVAAAPAYETLDKVATLGLTNGLTGGIALGAKAHSLGPVLAAIITQRTAEIVDVPTPPDVIEPQVLIIEPNLLPVTIEFRSQSSPVNINQVHIPGPPGEFKQTRSEEEPDRVLHEVVKPVIQEVREVIAPYRKITQEILPVQEEVHSLVARGENKKVLQEVAIPDPAPVVLHERIAAAPILEKRIAVQPVINTLGQSYAPALSGTIVRAGFIGGARVLEAPVEGGVVVDKDVEPIAQATRNLGRKVRREYDSENRSLNNRPSGPSRS